jgi:hypothetical protein
LRGLKSSPKSRKTMAKPTFVIVHGAWHSPAHFEPLMECLDRHGYKAVAPALPSVVDAVAGGQDVPKDAQADVNTIRKAILKVLDGDDAAGGGGSDVIVVPHSYGGIPATSAVRGLDRQTRQAQGFGTGVVGIAAVACFLLPEGLGLMDAEGKPRDPGHPLTSSDDPLVHPLPAHRFYQDLSDADSQKWAALLRPVSRGALLGPSGFSAHEVVPVHYLLATHDAAIAYSIQQRMVSLLQPTAVGVRTETLQDSSHSPFLSRVQETADFLRRSAGEEVG